ncbi:hypothetical protein [Ochrobactrum sp. AP1BH01-1]|nr:hypothetical protein [Ochrobactrum sp. AP1BH01-1]
MIDAIFQAGVKANACALALAFSKMAHIGSAPVTASFYEAKPKG